MTGVLVLARSDDPRRPSRLVPDLVAALETRRVPVRRLDPDRGVVDLGRLAKPDLVVLKSGTEAALSLGGALEAAGGLVVNPAVVAAACRDKIVQSSVLLRAGVPVPQSWLTVDPAALAEALAEGPLVVKDPRGSQGRGVHVVHRPAELEVLARRAGPRPRTGWLAMRYHPPEGPDLKVYRIGREVFGVEREFPARSLVAKLGRPVLVPPEVRRAALLCGEAFGIEVYGVDAVRSRGRWWVVDMSSFPGFKGVPDAGRRIVDHLARRGLLAA